MSFDAVYLKVNVRKDYICIIVMNKNDFLSYDTKSYVNSQQNKCTPDQDMVEAAALVGDDGSCCCSCRCNWRCRRFCRTRAIKPLTMTKASGDVVGDVAFAIPGGVPPSKVPCGYKALSGSSIPSSVS